MNFQSSLDWPEGGWQKAATTTTLMEWLEELLKGVDVHEAVIANERFRLILLATSNMNRVLRLLYYGGAWLHRLEATEISSLGLTFLRAYVKVARICLATKESRFPIHNKYHILFHAFHLMKCWAAKAEWQENPLVDSCQQDEAFVGIYSRRVSPKATIERILFHEFEEAPTWRGMKKSTCVIWHTYYIIFKKYMKIIIQRYSN